MSKRPVNLTLDEDILGYADQIMEARHFGSLVGLIEQLLREEFERRNGMVMILRETTKPNSSPNQSLADVIVDEAAARAQDADSAKRTPTQSTTYSNPRGSKKKRRALPKVKPDA